MAKRDSFLLRIDPQILDSIRRWAGDDLRSVNAQIEFLLRTTLIKNGRLPVDRSAGAEPDCSSSNESE